MELTKQKNYKDDLILKISFEFVKDIIVFVEQLEEKRKFAFTNQILRAVTSFVANIKEAQNVVRKSNFIYDLKIALKGIMSLNIGFFI